MDQLLKEGETINVQTNECIFLVSNVYKERLISNNIFVLKLIIIINLLSF